MSRQRQNLKYLASFVKFLSPTGRAKRRAKMASSVSGGISTWFICRGKMNIAVTILSLCLSRFKTPTATKPKHKNQAQQRNKFYNSTPINTATQQILQLNTHQHSNPTNSTIATEYFPSKPNKKNHRKYLHQYWKSTEYTASSVPVKSSAPASSVCFLTWNYFFVFWYVCWWKWRTHIIEPITEQKLWFREEDGVKGDGGR